MVLTCLTIALKAFYFLYGVWPTNGLAAPLTLFDDFQEAHLGPYIEYLEDKEHRLSFQDLDSPGLRHQFEKTELKDLYLGYSSSAFWIKLPIHSFLSRRETFLLEIAWPGLEYLELYDSSRKYAPPLLQGMNRAPGEKSFLHRNHVFELEFAPGEKKTIYLRLASRGLLLAPLWLYSRNAFQEKDRWQQFLFGMFVCLFLVAAFFHILMYLAVKERLYAYLTFFILSLGFFLAMQYGIIPEILAKKGMSTSSAIYAASFSLVLASIALFLSKYFASHEEQKASWLSIFAFASLLIAIVQMLFPRLLPRATNVALLGALLFLSIFYLLQRGISRFYELSPLILGAFLAFLAILGFLPHQALALKISQILGFAGIVAVNFKLSWQVRQRRLEHQRESLTLARIYTDFAIARHIQENILPKTLPESPYFALEALYLPKYDLGGDFYDYQILGQGELSVLIADATGHGVGAALLTAMLKVAYATETAKLRRPSELLVALDTKLQVRLGDHFITALALYLDVTAGELHYAHAGHPPLLHYQRENHVVIELKSPGTAIGFMDYGKPLAYIQKIQKGDRLLLFTDGLTDLINPQQELFSLERVKDLFLRHGDKSLSELKGIFLREIAHYKGSFEVSDDLTLILIEVRA